MKPEKSIAATSKQQKKTVPEFFAVTEITQLALR